MPITSGNVTQSVPEGWLTLAYESIPTGEEMCTPQRMAAMRNVEQAVVQVAGYADQCYVADGDTLDVGVPSKCLPPLSLFTLQEMGTRLLVGTTMPAFVPPELHKYIKLVRLAGNVSQIVSGASQARVDLETCRMLRIIAQSSYANAISAKSAQSLGYFFDRDFVHAAAGC